jgi:hypothetical protein
MGDYGQKENYQHCEHYEIDFGRRLVAKVPLRPAGVLGRGHLPGHQG